MPKIKLEDKNGFLHLGVLMQKHNPFRNIITRFQCSSCLLDFITNRLHGNNELKSSGATNHTKTCYALHSVTLGHQDYTINSPRIFWCNRGEIHHAN